MRQNLKNEESKNIDVSVETRGIEKVFNTLKKSGRNQNLEIIKELNKVFLSQKQCKYKKLIDESLLQLTPPDAISINLKTKEGTLTLTNKSSSSVAFKVQTSSPKVFLVNPSAGRLQEKGSATLKISVSLTEDITSKSHRFLIKAKESEDLNVDWKAADVKDYKIPARFDSPDLETGEEVKIDKVEPVENPNRFKTELFKSGIVKNFLAEHKELEVNRKSASDVRTLKENEGLADKSGKNLAHRHQELLANVENLKIELEKARNKQKFAVELEQLTSVKTGKFTPLHLMLVFVFTFLVGLYLNRG